MVVININFYYSTQLILKGHSLSFRFENIQRKNIQTHTNVFDILQ
jgi:hypothetical protein